MERRITEIRLVQRKGTLRWKELVDTHFKAKKYLSLSTRTSETGV